MEKITCQICKEYKAHNLLSHLRHAHPEIDLDVYKKDHAIVSRYAKKQMSLSHKGVKLSQSHRDSISKANKDNPKCADAARRTRNRLGTDTSEEARESMSQGALGKVITPEWRKKISEAQVERYKDPENRKKVSLGMAKMIAEGRRNNNQYKTGYLSGRLGRFYYRSSYELKFLELIDTDLIVANIQYEEVVIPYGSFQHYVPDYLVTLVDGRKFLVEIKPESFLSYCEEKFEAARAWCSKNSAYFLVLTEDFLFSSSSTTSLWETAEATAAPSPLQEAVGEDIVRPLR